MGKQRYWLMKSEPNTYSYADLVRAGRTSWEGVRNYQARNLLRDEVKLGDEVLFYHSSCDPPGAVGICRVVREGYPDHTAFDEASPYYDEKSDPEKPRWYMVDVEPVRALTRTVTLEELKAQAKRLGDFALIRKGNRLSVIPVSAAQWKVILALEQARSDDT